MHTLYSVQGMDPFLLFSFESSTWSDEGLITTRDESPNDSNLTICQSSHLTSFAVMVDVKGASESSVSKD